ncbi:MAG TPA: hypothetical protein EYH34_06855, partial [Planctomycetes bacterium]|nr:hypothetical protein [Planctomycetota bacterium]
MISQTTYDAADRSTGTSQVMVDAANPDGRTLWSTTTHYDLTGQVDWTLDRFGNRSETVYDQRGLVIQSRRRATDENGNTQWLVTRTVYDDKGQAIYTTDEYVDPGDGTSPPVWGTHTVYDAAGRVTKTERIKDMVVEIIDTATGQVVGDPSGSGLSTLASQLSGAGTVVSSTQTFFDSAGRVDYTVDQYGTETRYTYDAAGRQIETRTQAKDQNGQLQWLVTRTVYDAAGRTVVTTDQYVEGSADPVTGTRSVYDDAGRVVRTEKLEGVVVDIDATGPHPKSVLTDPGTVVWLTETLYDIAGRVVKSTGQHAPG